ncbi:uncharacterized protein IWZ02DRAFT_431689 [Phyllosticta citriasiana]|uniref:uncharacterized protein n=1 Tax=Phyllosticta citriasiana TaxID=595635 RepID=UPI0030FDC4D7
MPPITEKKPKPPTPQAPSRRNKNPSSPDPRTPRTNSAKASSAPNQHPTNDFSLSTSHDTNPRSGGNEAKQNRILARRVRELQENVDFAEQELHRRSRVVRKLESAKSNFQKQLTAQALEVNRVLSENTEVSRRNEVLEEEAEGYREALMDKMGEVEELRQRNEELRRRNEGLADSSREAMEMWGLAMWEYGCLRDSLGEEFDHDEDEGDDDNDDEVLEGDWNGDEDVRFETPCPLPDDLHEQLQACIGDGALTMMLPDEIVDTEETPQKSQ